MLTQKWKGNLIIVIRFIDVLTFLFIYLLNRQSENLQISNEPEIDSTGNEETQNIQNAQSEPPRIQNDSEGIQKKIEEIKEEFKDIGEEFQNMKQKFEELNEKFQKMMTKF